MKSFWRKKYRIPSQVEEDAMIARWHDEAEQVKNQAMALLKPYVGGSRRNPSTITQPDWQQLQDLLRQDDDADHLDQLKLEQTHDGVYVLWIGRYVDDGPVCFVS